jgi:two-component system sensor histidine kinase GlrK
MENIERLIRSSANGFRSRADARGISIKVFFDNQRGGSRQAEVSAKHLQIALRNLIDNAVKYSFRGTEGRPRDVVINGRAKDDFYEITIENYGVGIESDETISIFETGIQGRRAKYEVVTGAGLGLAMVKKYIAMHRGHISVISECKGDSKDPSPSLPFLTRFTIQLPYTFRGSSG